MTNDRPIEYPADVIRELASLRSMSEKGIALLAEAEEKFVRAELEADRQENLVFLDAQGTVADRTAIAKIKSEDTRLAAELARIEVNRIKLKLRHLSEAMNATQTAGKMIELGWKTAGIGER